jgi:hypothetical protein
MDLAPPAIVGLKRPLHGCSLLKRKDSISAFAGCVKGGACSFLAGGPDPILSDENIRFDRSAAHDLRGGSQIRLSPRFDLRRRCERVTKSRVERRVFSRAILIS